jgi:PKD repeat protein
MARRTLAILLTTIVLGFFSHALSQPYFEEHLVHGATDGLAGIHAGDLDGDGDVDIVGAAREENAVIWFRNDGGDPIEWTRQLIDPLFLEAGSVYAAYVNGDTLLDVLGAARSGDEIVWWRNEGGNPVQWTKFVIRAGYDFAHEVYAEDLDRDGDADVFGASSFLHCITWWRNEGGDPPAWTEQTIGTGFGGAKSVHVGDVDGDGQLDVAGAAILDNKVSWWRNEGGDPIQWTEHVVDDLFGGAHRVQIVDIDRDGRSDMLGAAYFADQIAWWRNGGGSPIQWTKQVIEAAFVRACIAYGEDLDGDGDMDVVGTAQDGDQIAWWRNDGGSPIQWTKFVLDDLQRVWPAYACDLDSDGDHDVMAGSGWGGTYEVKWWENLGSAYAFPDFSATPQTGHAPLTVGFTDLTIAVPAATAWAWDLDGDGQTDSTDRHPSWTYQIPGIYTVALTVANDSLQETEVREGYVHVFNGESALTFDGTGHARCPASPELALADRVTLEAWIRPNEGTTFRSGRILDKGAVSLLLVVTSGSLNQRSILLQLTNEQGTTFRVTTPENSVRFDDSWQHVAAAYDAGGDVRVYLDGVLQPLTGTQPAGTLADNDATDCVLANSLSLSSGLAAGMDEVRIWGACRAEYEIQQTMQRHLTGHEPGLVACWRMNEGNGDTLLDATESQLIATVHGAEWIEGVALVPAGADEGVMPTPTQPRIIRSATPNPFRTSVTLSLHVDSPTVLRLSVYDVSGRLVRTLVNGRIDPGIRRVEWDGRDAQGATVGQGLYVIRCVEPEGQEQEMVLRIGAH